MTTTTERPCVVDSLATSVVGICTAFHSVESLAVVAVVIRRFVSTMAGYGVKGVGLRLSRYNAVVIQPC